MYYIKEINKVYHVERLNVKKENKRKEGMMSGKEFRMKWAERSGQYLEEAHALFSERMGNLLVVTKLYHALMYCLFGFFSLEDPGSYSHTEIIERFEGIDSGKDPSNLSVVNTLKSLYPFVHTCGLPRPQDPDDEYVRTIFDIADTFLKKVSSLSP